MWLGKLYGNYLVGPGGPRTKCGNKFFKEKYTFKNIKIVTGYRKTDHFVQVLKNESLASK